jgi:hypothetical protein
MKKSSCEMNLYELKKDLSMETGLGYPVFLAGMLFWLSVGISSFIVTQQTLVWMYVFGIGAIMPLAILISKLLRMNFLSAHNPLSIMSKQQKTLFYQCSIAIIYLFTHILPTYATAFLI